MEFADNKPIYRQIIDYCHQCIVSAIWLAGDRIPSTKELGVTLAVNNRTIMKAYDELAAAGIIYQKRGMGYYVSDDAMQLTLRELRREFMEVTIPEFLAAMRRASLTPADIIPLING